MKKTMYLSLALLLLTASGGWAYDFNDTTLVQPWYGNSAATWWGGWMDVIGNTDVYDTKGANWNGSTLSIFSNWNPGKDGDLGATTADLFILSNGTMFAIRLDTTGMGTVYGNPQQISYSKDFFASSGDIYGGQFNQASPSLVPVQGTSSNTSSTSVVWTYGSNGFPSKVDVDLSKLGLANEWTFVWGTATCANDTFSGQVVGVPEPGSLLLLGVGFAGLGFYRRKGVRK